MGCWVAFHEFRSGVAEFLAPRLSFLLWSPLCAWQRDFSLWSSSIALRYEREYLGSVKFACQSAHSEAWRHGNGNASLDAQLPRPGENPFLPRVTPAYARRAPLWVVVHITTTCVPFQLARESRLTRVPQPHASAGMPPLPNERKPPGFHNNTDHCCFYMA
jgi:hypothetical protein